MLMSKIVKPPIVARSSEELPPKAKVRKSPKLAARRAAAAPMALYRRIIE